MTLDWNRVTAVCDWIRAHHGDEDGGHVMYAETATANALAYHVWFSGDEEYGRPIPHIAERASVNICVHNWSIDSARINSTVVAEKRLRFVGDAGETPEWADEHRLAPARGERIGRSLRSITARVVSGGAGSETMLARFEARVNEPSQTQTHSCGGTLVLLVG